MKTLSCYILSVFLLLIISGNCFAQEYSYVYIQGDKKTPFYVKLDGIMLPRYAKNYTIIPKLHTGNINIEILFQQNIYPPQQFTIAVPGQGYRALMLDRKNDSFALYDLIAKTYLTK